MTYISNKARRPYWKYLYVRYKDRMRKVIWGFSSRESAESALERTRATYGPGFGTVGKAER